MEKWKRKEKIHTYIYLFKSSSLLRIINSEPGDRVRVFYIIFFFTSMWRARGYKSLLVLYYYYNHFFFKLIYRYINNALHILLYIIYFTLAISYLDIYNSYNVMQEVGHQTEIIVRSGLLSCYYSSLHYRGPCLLVDICRFYYLSAILNSEAVYIIIYLSYATGVYYDWRKHRSVNSIKKSSIASIFGWWKMYNYFEAH